MKRREPQAGIALITTLIMLAVVTLMAVTFLAVSRRERAAVATTSDRMDAKEMAETALQRAEAEILSRVLTTSNLLSYEYLVSTNFINPAGFVANDTNIANVSYRYANGDPVTGNDLLQVYRNLQIDPRAPVFVITNSLTGAEEFRYYLDLNRNGLIETNGFQVEIDRNGRSLGITNFHIGDPEWIAVLRRPDHPHSGSNLISGRFAYMILPAGKSLDLNFIHNHAKRTLPVQEGFYRNQGVGSWELNLAAFLRDLNTNVWNTYSYVTGNVFATSSGVCFENAFTILQGRYRNDFRNLISINALFGGGGTSAFRQDGLDGYSDGPLQLDTFRPYNNQPPNVAIIEDDDTTRPWPGAENPNQYFDVQELFSLAETGAVIDRFTNRLIQASITPSTYDRHTLYRLLGQLGTDSVPNYLGKIHLNFDNRLDFETNLAGMIPSSAVGYHATNFVGWTPSGFFTNAADRILRTLNPPRGPGAPLLSLTNIPIWPTNRYSPGVHHSLQLAANIFDATANRVLTNFSYIPAVFRPVYSSDANGVRITGYEELTDDWEIRLWNTPGRPGIAHVDIDEAALRASVQKFDVVAGVPVIIGAKKGYPNFNEFASQTVVVAGRKLELVKRSPLSRPAFTNQLYTLAVSNVFGVEFWNSYHQDFPRRMELRARLETEMVLSNEVRIIRRYTNIINYARTFNAGEWKSQQFQVPIQTNVLFVPNSMYSFQNGGVLLPLTNTVGRNLFEAAGSFPTPVWRLSITNRLRAALIDHPDDATLPRGRLVDYVDLDNLNTHMDITRELAGEEDLSGQTSTIGSFWKTNRVQGIPEGVRNQIQASLGGINVPNWNSISAEPLAGQDKEKAIERFRQFLGLSGTPAPPPPTLRMQAPLSPGLKLVQRNEWQVNDPLVNDLSWDLEDPGRSNVVDRLPPLFPITADRSNLGQINYRYRPWQRGLYSSGDNTDFDLAVKDPQVTQSDDWEFPTNALPSVGWLGRIHRGTPWQTIYLKSTPVSEQRWVQWSGNPTWTWSLNNIAPGSQPTNDWLILDLFTTAVNESSTRGQLSVNQDGVAAWSAVLSGVPIFTNQIASTNFGAMVFEPNTPELHTIVDGINLTRTQRFGQKFNYLGEILSTPQLTVQSPFLRLAPTQNGMPMDAVVERIPQMILSLLKRDEPRFVVLAYGQSLRPAPGSVVTDVGPFFQMPTNYVVTGEYVTKTLIHLETVVEPDPVTGQPITRIKPIKESYNEVPPTE